ncbi:Secreted protein [Phytophthora cinnamomi]|uniref:Secreted protein n=1 Tax=Phytophthora cinnamomi TaxID=4785 RepID=UPI00355A99D0|nr:Secreted protein [Phytophthora cinnamomi]
MITRGTTDQATPSSPSSRAVTAPSDSELPAAAAGVAPPEVVDVTGVDEPWTTAPARRTSEPAPLRTSRRATSKPASGKAMVDARTGKKKVSKRATVASTAGTPRKPTGDSGRDSDSDLEDKPPAPPAKKPKKTVTSAKTKQAKAVAVVKRPAATSRSGGRLDLHEYMASFSPGTAVEESAATEDPAAQASSTAQGVVGQHDHAVPAQVQALQAEIERLRALVARQGVGQLPVVPAPAMHASPAAPNAPNSKGEMTPADVCYLTTANFPDGAKKAKGTTILRKPTCWPRVVCSVPSARRQVQRPPNHGSARDRLNVLRKNIRKEQDAGRCLVLDRDLLKQWPGIIISPFGVVDKGGEDTNVTGRTIHDLSYPEGTSINDCTDQDSIVKPEYTHCDAVATEILKSKRAHPNARVCVMAGDVASAFRNISIHSNSVYLFAGHIEEDDVIVIELAAPFGWTGPPGFYEIAGGAVAYVHGSHTTDTIPDGFFNYHWVGDHINVAADIGTSCDDANRSLRYAMVAVLGADAINAKKFTDWNTRQRVLGLVFDSVAETVSMPPEKILKAREIVADAFAASSLSRQAYRSLMGSIRHGAT